VAVDGEIRLTVRIIRVVIVIIVVVADETRVGLDSVGAEIHR
jgi:hypothetical protein